MLEKNIFGIIGVAIALLGLAIAVFQNEMRSPEAKTAMTVNEPAGKSGITFFGEKIEVRETADAVTITYRALGFLAIGLGVASFVRKENHRISALAGALGAAAVAWEYVLIAIGVAFLVLIVGAFS